MRLRGDRVTEEEGNRIYKPRLHIFRILCVTETFVGQLVCHFFQAKSRQMTLLASLLYQGEINSQLTVLCSKSLPRISWWSAKTFQQWLDGEAGSSAY